MKNAVNNIIEEFKEQIFNFQMENAEEAERMVKGLEGIIQEIKQDFSLSAFPENSETLNLTIKQLKFLLATAYGAGEEDGESIMYNSDYATSKSGEKKINGVDNIVNSLIEEAKKKTEKQEEAILKPSEPLKNNFDTLTLKEKLSFLKAKITTLEEKFGSKKETEKQETKEKTKYQYNLTVGELTYYSLSKEEATTRIFAGLDNRMSVSIQKKF